MKRNLVVAICFSVMMMATSASAQFRIGPTGGLNFNRQIFKSNTYRYDGIFKTRLGFHIGVLSDLVIRHDLSLQTELLYSLRGGHYKSERTNLAEEYHDDLGYVSLPICLTYKYDVKAGYIIVGAGPYLEKLIHSSHKYYSNGSNIESGQLRVGTDYTISQVKPWGAGVKIKAGFELKKGMYCVGYYDIGTTDINPQFQVTRNKTFGVQLAYIFSLTEEDRYNRFENFYEF
ncbi:MAG TPA: porin family protein [Chitinophagaceae bacterium]|nr:porin family protein [Chitinophagaceae bacterium]